MTVCASGCCHLRRFTRESSCVSVCQPSGEAIANYPDGGTIVNYPPEGVVADGPGAVPPISGTMDVFGDDAYESVPSAHPTPDGGTWYAAPRD